METMSFCIATHSLSKGNGIDITVAEFAKELSKYHNVKLAAIFSDMSVPGIDIIHYPVNKLWNLRAAAKDIDRQHFDYISTHYIPFDMVAALSHTPYLIHDYGVPPLSLVKKRQELKQWFQVNSQRLLVARKAVMALPISEYLGREFRRKYMYRGKMEVLPAGIEFPVDEPEPAGGFGKYVLYVGRHSI
jgi:hypothetical protein